MSANTTASGNLALLHTDHTAALAAHAETMAAADDATTTIYYDPTDEHATRHARTLAALLGVTTTPMTTGA